jgi:hypothetical protein
MKHIFTAAAIMAAALTGLSLTGPSVVSAGTASQAAAVRLASQYSKGSAGYMMTGGGWRFRYLATTLTVPAAGTRATRASVTLWDDADALYLWVMAGGGPGSIQYMWSWETQSTPLAVTPNVGDRVTVSIYYDQQARHSTVAAVDHTQGTSAMQVTGGHRGFAWAQVSAGGPAWSLASSKTRLWASQDTRLTSFNGTHGAIFGPWGTYRIVGTRGGTSSGTVVLWPSYPWNNGHNFGIWWRTSS